MNPTKYGVPMSHDDVLDLSDYDNIQQWWSDSCRISDMPGLPTTTDPEVLSMH
jgi:hypothetical protein